MKSSDILNKIHILSTIYIYEVFENAIKRNIYI